MPSHGTTTRSTSFVDGRLEKSETYITCNHTAGLGLFEGGKNNEEREW